jgi:hypothetical protein
VVQAQYPSHNSESTTSKPKTSADKYNAHMKKIFSPLPETGKLKAIINRIASWIVSKLGYFVLKVTSKNENEYTSFDSNKRPPKSTLLRLTPSFIHREAGRFTDKVVFQMISPMAGQSTIREELKKKWTHVIEYTGAGPCLKNHTVAEKCIIVFDLRNSGRCGYFKDLYQPVFKDYPSSAFVVMKNKDQILPDFLKKFFPKTDFIVIESVNDLKGETLERLLKV